MSRIVWDRVGTRRYESGLDRGVIYPADRPAEPWSGLTSVKEKSDRSSDPVYFDGVKINDGIIVGEFSASLSCVTYPEVLDELQGGTEVRRGVLITEQSPEMFAFCYRSKIGNDTGGDAVGYKIHILYNVMALPDDRDYASATEDLEIVEFAWDLSTTPAFVPGFRPTSHIELDTRKMDPWLLEDVERMLYGAPEVDAALMPIEQLLEFLQQWFRIKITDNDDGTWTATEARPGFIHIYGDDDEFLASRLANAHFIDEGTYVISDLADLSELTKMAIHDNGDGSWTASSDNDATIVIDEETGIFQLHDVEPIFSGPIQFRLADQFPDS